MDYSFEMEGRRLSFNPDKSVLTCLSPERRKLWVKKIDAIGHILSIIEDGQKYYAACEVDDVSGELIALDRDSGSTVWYIPGRPYLQQLFNGDIYAIFTDPDNIFYFLRITTDEGKTKWHHTVADDLREYSIKKERVILHYHSGKSEELDARTGVLLRGSEPGK